MGKYLIKVESTEHDEALDQRYQKGIECDGFVIMADKGEGATTCMHDVSIDTISDMILLDSKLMEAAILAEAKRKIEELMEQSKIEAKADALKKLLGLD